ncbi:hypothetical protein [Flavobacterium luteum]|uniref:Uncharacterized protein n=1 Tax=Flavobacterium luteum TaxID=2026654 RepID=A0A7J5ADT9_9FLAO|nr:hypothetical protein [Flavobacterium luteum]KAB1155608.1 hypothetical protein F6464_10875 [Flavobacterium luteum]
MFLCSATEQKCIEKREARSEKLEVRSFPVVHQHVTSSVFVQCNGTKMYREARSDKLEVGSWKFPSG